MNRILRQIVTEVPFKNLIVIYGSSTDRTREIAEEFTNKVFWDEDKGLGAARNLGVRKATSEIVAMIDTDVILTEGWYEILIRYFEDPEVAAVMGTCIFGYGCLPLERFWKYKAARDEESWGCHNTMFRRQVVLQVGNFNETIRGAGEDYDLYLRLLDAGYKWVWVREGTAYHPMTMYEHLKHVNWWSQNGPRMREAMRDVNTKSLFRVTCNSTRYILRALWQGLNLSICVHPTMLLYFPLMETISVTAVLKRLKAKMREYELLPDT
jgi:GT2 family glycosyltransferase